jgi:hypothetical protein
VAAFVSGFGRRLDCEFINMSTKVNFLRNFYSYFPGVARNSLEVKAMNRLPSERALFFLHLLSFISFPSFSYSFFLFFFFFFYAVGS